MVHAAGFEPAHLLGVSQTPYQLGHACIGGGDGESNPSRSSADRVSPIGSTRFRRQTPPMWTFSVVHNTMESPIHRPSPVPRVSIPSADGELDLVRATGRIAPARPRTLARMRLVEVRGVEPRSFR